ncbi:BA14K family protein [Rhizobium sp. XQZ8]|uniref:BA14K family protein n=1 Tax=Rhizobium populisoli TaxID=2859785 RepID=UPI001C666F7D|nr:BA14K family protein [Rhizobium populisoli]MBW6425453.1 BA14K family protein [Rhizobium populisoli]
MAEAKPAQRVKVMLSSARTTDAAGEQGAPSDVLLAQRQAARTQQWCGARYRSYNPSDNTYQPYGGGQRQACNAPVETPAASVDQVADIDRASVPDATVRWCMERYSSYRIADNTYQPFTGGRKQCSGAGSQSASNAVRDVDGTTTVIRF